eukprot:sb/3470431/
MLLHMKNLDFRANLTISIYLVATPISWTRAFPPRVSLNPYLPRRMISVAQCPPPMLAEWKGEVDWFLGTLAQIERRHQMRVALCHNDLNHNNILIPGSEDNGDQGDEDKFILIDYEYTEPTETSKQPIKTRYLGHVTGYQPIRDQYFLIRDDKRLPADDQILKMIKVHKRVVKPTIHTPDNIMLNQVNKIYRKGLKVHKIPKTFL